MRIAIVSLLCSLLSIALAGCEQCPGQEGLPRARCTPIDAGADGCVGLPGVDLATNSSTYPIGCAVDAPDPKMQCGVTMVCLRTVEDAEPIWNHYL